MYLSGEHCAHCGAVEDQSGEFCLSERSDRPLWRSTSVTFTTNMLISLPIEQPQPNQEFYGLDVLTLFQTYTRAQFEAAGGPLIPFDPARPEPDRGDATYAGNPPARRAGLDPGGWGRGGHAPGGSF